MKTLLKDKKQLTLAGTVVVLSLGVFFLMGESEQGQANVRAPLNFRIDVPEPEFGDLPDFASYQDVNEMKQVFFDFLEPIVNYQNQLIAEQRRLLLGVSERFEKNQSLTSQELKFVQVLAEQYELEWTDQSTAEVLEVLERRVDVIPQPLVLVQAAKESGWGRSRFAVDANNLFGQWCYTEGCGLVPERRGEGQRNEIKYFETVDEAIYSYMHNLNTHVSYRDFRDSRQELRDEDEPLTGAQLADGLLYYSQRRQAYVDEIKAMLRQYHEFQAERDI